MRVRRCRFISTEPLQIPFCLSALLATRCAVSDPDLWFDARGNWHILYHVYTKVNDYRTERYSGHAFSTDVRYPFPRSLFFPIYLALMVRVALALLSK